MTSINQQSRNNAYPKTSHLYNVTSPLKQPMHVLEIKL